MAIFGIHKEVLFRKSVTDLCTKIKISNSHGLNSRKQRRRNCQKVDQCDRFTAKRSFYLPAKQCTHIYI